MRIRRMFYPRRTRRMLCIILCSAGMVLGLFSGGYAPAAQAQSWEIRNLHQKMERLQRDVQMLQRQWARGELPEHDAEDTLSDMPPASAVNLQGRLAELEEDLRRLRGQYEQLEFRQQRLEKQLEALSMAPPAATRPLPNQLAPLSTATSADYPGNLPPSAPDNEGKLLSAENRHDTDTNEAPNTPATTPLPRDASGTLHIPAPDGASTEQSPQSLYDHGFRLLRQARYDEATAALKRFTRQYSEDPLIGNAYYWLGEAYYVQRDYVQAADNFRAGFEALPKGPKAPDNLLKLALALGALEENDKACVVLKQLKQKFTSAPRSIRERTTQEIQRLSCA